MSNIATLARATPRDPGARGKAPPPAPGAKPADRTDALIADPPAIIPSAARAFSLDRLRRAEENVRHTRPDEAVDELVASIRAHGLIHNLIGYEVAIGGYPDTRIMIVGGGRRFKAISILAEEGELPEDWPVPVLVRPREDALELSLAENIEHKNMSPVDEFFAFKALIDTGRYDAATLAARFGFTERMVKQRLRLAELDPVVLDALAERAITLDAAMAFAGSSDRELQRKVFKQHASPNAYDRYSPSRIKRDLLHAGKDTADRLYKYVGAKAYEAAGGGYEDELFQDERQERVLNAPYLLERLAHERLDTEEMALVRELATRKELAPTVEGVVRIPGLALHSPNYINGAPAAPAGFAAVAKQSYNSEAAWRTVRNNNLPVQVAVGIDGDGKVQAYAHTLFVPKEQRTALEPPPGEVKQSRYVPPTPEERAAAERKHGIERWQRRLAVGSFAGTPFEGRAFWAGDWSQAHQLNGEPGQLIDVSLWASDAAIAAQAEAAAAAYDAEFARDEAAGGDLADQEPAA